MKHTKINIDGYSNLALLRTADAIYAVVNRRKRELKTPTEMSKLIGINSGAKMNKILESMGFIKRKTQAPIGEYWGLTKEGRKHGEMFVLNTVQKPLVCVKGEISYEDLQYNVLHGEDSWADQEWVTLSTYNIRWRDSLIPILESLDEQKLKEFCVRNNQIMSGRRFDGTD